MDIRISVIDSFTTFFLLSHIKVLSTTSDLLIPTKIYQLGSNISTFGTLDCRWISAAHLLLRPLLYIILALTLSMMFFVYATIALVVTLIVVINIQPFKKAVVRYPLADSIFLVLLSLVFIAITGQDIASRENPYQFHTAIIVATLSVVVPLFYIASLITFWLVTKIKQIYHAFC